MLIRRPLENQSVKPWKRNVVMSKFSLQSDTGFSWSRLNDNDRPTHKLSSLLTFQIRRMFLLQVWHCKRDNRAVFWQLAVSPLNQGRCVLSSNTKGKAKPMISQTVWFSADFSFFLSSLSTLENSQFVQLKKNNASKPKKKVVEQIRYLIKKGKGHFNADFN